MVGGADAPGTCAEAVTAGDLPFDRPDVRRRRRGGKQRGLHPVGLVHHLLTQDDHGLDLRIETRIKLTHRSQKTARRRIGGACSLLFYGCRFRLIRYGGGTADAARHILRCAIAVGLHHVLQLIGELFYRRCLVLQRLHLLLCHFELVLIELVLPGEALHRHGRVHRRPEARCQDEARCDACDLQFFPFVTVEMKAHFASVCIFISFHSCFLISGHPRR